MTVTPPLCVWPRPLPTPWWPYFAFIKNTVLATISLEIHFISDFTKTVLYCTALYCSWCGGKEYLEEPCTTLCPVDCKFNAWGPWGPCDSLCGPGLKNRTAKVKKANNSYFPMISWCFYLPVLRDFFPFKCFLFSFIFSKSNPTPPPPPLRYQIFVFTPLPIPLYHPCIQQPDLHVFSNSIPIFGLEGGGDVERVRVLGKGNASSKLTIYSFFTSPCTLRKVK